MADISQWSTSAASNNAAPPNGAPSNWNASQVAPVVREVMAAIRRQFEDAQWWDGGWTVGFAASNSFTVVGDRRTVFHTDRRVRIRIGASSYLYGYITSSSYTSPNTTVVVSLDGGAITNQIQAVSVGVISSLAHSLPRINAGMYDAPSVEVQVPVGCIVMWSGAISAIPAGWRLCDGASGTPDLRNRFIVGAGNLYGVGNVGGSKDAAVVAHVHSYSGSTGGASADHSHSFTTGVQSANHTHTFTTSGAGAHQHALHIRYVIGGSGSLYAAFSGADLVNTQNQYYTNASLSDQIGNHTHSGTTDGISQNHTHSGTTGGHSATHTHSYSGNTGSAGTSGVNANMPPYYALCFIMKVTA